MIETLIKEGKIVPVAITCALLKTAMEKAGWGSKKFLIDGFPRNEENFNGWQEAMGPSVEVPCIIHFDASEEEMTTRIMERAKTSGRVDDNLDSLKKRFNNFRTEQMPIIDKFAAQGKAKKINGL